MTVLALGVSHRTLAVGRREEAALPDLLVPDLLRDLLASGAVAEAAALSTCNRTEVYVADADAAGAERAVTETLVARTRIPPGVLAESRYALRDDDAAAHLFRVAASLDSMVIGEGEIQRQVRDAWDRARSAGACGPVLNRLFRQALQTGKAVRSETRIGAGSASVPAIAVDAAAGPSGDLAGRRALVIGAGRVARAAVLRLGHRGAGEVTVANRTAASARDLARRVGGRAVGLDDLVRELARADVVVCATASERVILTRDVVAKAMARRGDRPMALVDVAVPRDVDPGAAAVPGVGLHDIDDLRPAAEAALNGRRAEAERAEAEHIRAAVGAFSAWRRGRPATPAIVSLRERAEEIRRHEVDRASGRLAHLGEEDRRRVDALTRGIVNRLLHEPTVRAREAAESGEGMRHVESLRHLFGIESSGG